MYVNFFEACLVDHYDLGGGGGGGGGAGEAHRRKKKGAVEERLSRPGFVRLCRKYLHIPDGEEEVRTCMDFAPRGLEL